MQQAAAVANPWQAQQQAAHQWQAGAHAQVRHSPQAPARQVNIPMSDMSRQAAARPAWEQQVRNRSQSFHVKFIHGLTNALGNCFGFLFF